MKQPTRKIRRFTKTDDMIMISLFEIYYKAHPLSSQTASPKAFVLKFINFKSAFRELIIEERKFEESKV